MGSCSVGMEDAACEQRGKKSRLQHVTCNVALAAKECAQPVLQLITGADDDDRRANVGHLLVESRWPQMGGKRCAGVRVGWRWRAI